jgi:hypothetical protein
MRVDHVCLSACILCFFASAVMAQVVEKYSTSFSFPLTVTAAMGAKNNMQSASFFRSAGRILQKRTMAFEWSAAPAEAKGSISVYSVSGALVAKIAISKNRGSVQCDLSRAAAGVYIATIRYGAYRHNIMLALSR